ncbi:hypothetical protein B566_EDAN015838 [Ephemera danica]|nr:hypothetical protein B566_EDAN015838 [Ephemera danica]
MSASDDQNACSKVESYESVRASVVQKLGEMASKKKQDEKNLKLLRELVAIPSNKHCFDCQQRGPTYVNMTIGSFVCTTCSGLLRGLTPPHRVKSISMASFTDEEITLLKSRGNEYCKRVWLGLYDPAQVTDVSDESHVKDFMINKYERKRFYLDPSKITMPVFQAKPSPQPAVSLPPVSATPVALPRTAPVNNNNSHRPPDPFSPISSTPPVPFAAPVQDNFANFDNNPIFNATGTNPTPTKQQSGQQPQPMSTSSTPVLSNHSSPGQDRYAALKDLDSLMRASTTASPWGVNGTTSNVFESQQQQQQSQQQTPNSSNSASVFLTPEHGTSTQSHSPGNPFVVSQSSNNNPWGSPTPPTFPQPATQTFSRTNPFDTPTNGGFGNHQGTTAADAGWAANFQDSFGSPMSQTSGFSTPENNNKGWNAVNNSFNNPFAW